MRPSRLWPSRLFWRIFAAYVVLTLVSAAIFVAILSARQRDVVTEHVRQRLHDTAVVLSGHMRGVFDAEQPPPGLRQPLAQYGAANGTRLTLIAADGTVLGDSAEDPMRMDNHIERPEIQQAKRSGAGLTQRSSATLGIPMMYFALPVGDPTEPKGYVRVARAMESVNAQVASVQRLVWGTALAISVVVLTFTYFVLSRITRLLETLTQAAKDIADGELQHNVIVKSRDELGTLAEAFNAMSEELAARVDELQRRSRELEENSERLATVLGGMIDGVVAVDSSERVLFANRADLSLLEVGGSAAAGRPIWELVRQTAIRDVVRSALAGKEQQSVVLEISRAQKVVELLATRLPGQPSPGAVLVLHDVAELRRLENLRREFVSNVSHELKTPLTAIQAYAETLLAGAIDDSNHSRRFVKRIQEQADRLHALILDLLRLARIESNQDVFEVTSVAVDDIIKSCVAEHAAIAESKCLTLAVEPPSQAIRVLADAEGVRTILDNLIDNAVKYTPLSGRVTVRWRPQYSTAVIEVEHTGVGIDEAQQSRVFERFYRVDKARSRELGGTGLGLSIVKHRTQVFGGSVHLGSQPGKGSTFAVRLPLASKLEKVQA